MPRHPIATLAAAAMLVALPVTAAEAADTNWSRQIPQRLTGQQLGLGGDVSAERLGRAALARRAKALTGGDGALGAVRLHRRDALAPPGGRRATVLQFVQTVDGRRVLWSQLDVMVADGAVTSMSGTVVPLTRRSAAGERRISAARARRIARAAVAGAGGALPAQPVIYAGDPEAPRAPREAFVVQVAAPGLGTAADDEQPTLCVVVDAESGKVLTRWRGTAKQASRRPPAPKARAAAAKTYLLQIADNKKSNVDLASSGVNIFTTGDPYTWGIGFATRERESFGSPSSAFLGSGPAQPYSQITQATQHLCVKRDYCGRDGGQPGPEGQGDINRWFFSVNFAGCRKALCSTHYDLALDRIFLEAEDNNDPDTIAHELGHVIDHHYRDDFAQTFESAEVEEALAEMFAYDSSYKTDFQTGEVPINAILASPNSFVYPGIGTMPQRMSQYRCDVTDPHFNGYILAHAYWRWIEDMNKRGLDGRRIAGTLLQYVPWALPAKRTFGNTNFAFRELIKAFYGMNSEVHAAYIDGFGHGANLFFEQNRKERGCKNE